LDAAASACMASNISGYNILKSFYKDPQLLLKKSIELTIPYRNTFIQKIPTVSSKGADITELKKGIILTQTSYRYSKDT